MAIDEKTGKRIKLVKTVLDEQKELYEKSMPNENTNYEEELKKKLFEIDEEKEKFIQKGLDIIQAAEDEEIIGHHARPNKEWDVPITEEILYFDPELSYELTGYRPITMDKGLDFDPEPFREMAKIYEEKGKYTEFPEGSKPWRDLWNREVERMKNGYTVGKYRITGDNYYYLNYYRMQTVSEEQSKAGEGRTENFPMFLSKQYEWFHYVELAEKVGKDIGALKARGVGWSEMIAAMAVRPYTTTPKYNVLLTAAADAQLQPLLDKCWFQLDWLNTNTSGGLRHVRQKVNNNDTKRASKVLKDGTETGFQSQISSIVADEPKKIRGYRQDRLIFEECFGKGTKVVMADYSRKSVENIKVGDFVLGIDGTPQEVINTCKGVDDLYKVTQKMGIDYVVNSKHKIFFESRNCGPNGRFLMTPVDFLNRPNNRIITSYGLSCTGIDNPKKNDYELDPYYFGLWLGDGYSKNPNRIIVNIKDDQEIIDYLVSYYSSFDGGYIDAVKDTHECCRIYCKKGYPRGKNPIIQQYKRLGLLGNKHIPKEVFKSSMEYKLKVLAGIIDTDGCIKSKRLGKSFEIEMSRANLIKEIGELAQICGLKVHYSERSKAPHFIKNHYTNESHSYSVTIKGDLNKIPTLLPRKQVFDKRCQHTCTTGIRVEPCGRGEYYGFTLKSYNKEWDNFFYLDDYTIVHNCGNNKNLVKSWIQGAALTQLGGIHFGSRIFLGTSGEEIDMDGLAQMFSNPTGYDILPYKNYDTFDGKPEYTAFFLPAHKFALSKKYLDNRGVTNHIEFRKYYEVQRSKLTGKAYTDECAEHCFIPEEALAKTGANVFDGELIAEQMTNLRVRNMGTKPTSMALNWDSTAPLYTKVEPAVVKNSNLLVVEPPVRDETGKVYKNLYVAGIDGIDMGTENSALDNDVSQFCIVIKKRVFGAQEPKYVAMYKARPRKIEQAYEMALKLLIWYDCQCMLEYTKIGFQQYLKERKKDNLLMTRPEYAVSVKNRKTSSKRLIGIPGTEAVIKHGLELIDSFIQNYYYTIDYPDMLEEMLKYTYENKRKFDIIAALSCCEIGDEAMTGIFPVKKNEITSNNWRDIGYYIDDRGYRRYGVIPNKTETLWQN